VNIPDAIYFRHQVRRFAILFVGRSGSSYLTSLLDSHPNVRSLYDELTELKDKGAKAQLEWANRALTPPLVGRNGAVGFKTKPANVLDLDAFSRLLEQNQCRIIELQRRNRIKSVVSHLNGRRLAEATGMWGLFNESARPEPLHIDPDEFDQVLHHREEVDQALADYVDSLPLPKISLAYEDMLQDEDRPLQKLFSFLDIPPKTVQGISFKITSDNLREAIVNFDELYARYIGTEYEAMFDEVLIQEGL
jgi:LPS sulfotransferase NodH